MKILIFLYLIFNLKPLSNGANLDPSYKIIYDPIKALEWSDNRALGYITTVQLFNNDHHIFEYRRYPCQYFYTAEIQMDYNNQTTNKCIYNTTTSDYEYNFQLHLNPHSVEPYVLRNIAIQCKYINCSLSLLTVKYLRIDWNLQGREKNPNCTFDNARQYGIYESIQYKGIYDKPKTLSEWITVRCKNLLSCNNSKSTLEHFLSTNIRIVYGSLYELGSPYCSLEKNIAYLIETNFAQTNRLLVQLVNIMQRGFGKPDEREQASMKEYVEHKWLPLDTNSTTNTTTFTGEVHGTFKQAK